MPLEAASTSRPVSKAAPSQRVQAQHSQRYAHATPVACHRQHTTAPSPGVFVKQAVSKSVRLECKGGRDIFINRLRVQAAASSPAETAVSTSIVLKQCELSFGDTVKAVGETDLFGSWDSDKGPELQWQEGHDWLAKLDVPPGDCTFKLVIVNGSGAAQWESGDNRTVLVPGDASGGQVTIMCHFNQTTSTEVQVTPAAAAQQSSPESQVPDEQAPVDDLTDDFAAGDAAVQVPAVQDRAEDVQEQAESVTDSPSPAIESQEQATAEVEEKVNEAAPEEDLSDTLSVLQGAEATLEEQEQPQASSDATIGAVDSFKPAEAESASTEAESGRAEQSASPPSSPQDNGAEDYSSFKTFGKSRVTDVARDGAITFTFEEDDDVDARSLSSQLLGSS